MNIRQKIGDLGENLTAQHLEKQGFKIIDRNYRRRFGEIDLIATKKDVLVFVEVKMRRNPLFDPTEVITRSKQKKLIMTAKDYLARHDHTDKGCRFDVAIVTQQGDSEPEISYIEDAFRE